MRLNIPQFVSGLRAGRSNTKRDTTKPVTGRRLLASLLTWREPVRMESLNIREASRQRAHRLLFRDAFESISDRFGGEPRKIRRAMAISKARRQRREVFKP